MVTDPVCGMTVGPNATNSLEHQGKRYYFCCQGCLAKFRAQPANYLQSAPSPAAAVSITAAAAPAGGAGDVTYTCPMHPEIRKLGAGSCPICGMALEPVVATLVEDRAEVDDMTRRFGIAVVLTLPVLLLGMGDVLPGLDASRWLSYAMAAWLQALLATPVVWAAGWPLLVRAWQSYRRGRAEHVQPDRTGYAGSLVVQRGGAAVAATAAAGVQDGDAAPLYFEVGGDDHDAGAAGPGAGTAGAGAHRQRHQSAAGAGAGQRGAHQR